MYTIANCLPLKDKHTVSPQATRRQWDQLHLQLIARPIRNENCDVTPTNHHMFIRYSLEFNVAAEKTIFCLLLKFPPPETHHLCATAFVLIEQ